MVERSDQSPPFPKGDLGGNVNMASRHYIKGNKKALPSGKALHINLGNLIIYPYNPWYSGDVSRSGRMLRGPTPPVQRGAQ